MFPAEPTIIGELPIDDLKLLEENYQKELKALLARRGITKELVNERVIKLVPGENNRTVYVMAIEPPSGNPAKFPPEEF